MLLAIDVGNTNITVAIFDDRNKVGSWRISTDGRRTADEYAVWLTQLLGLSGIERGAIDDVVMASVVPSATFNLEWLCRKHLGCTPMIVTSELDLGIKNRLDNPKEAGADRLVNALAARNAYGPNLIIVDVGTATNFDVIDGNGDYVGGVIALGPHPALEALHQIAAKLPKVELERPDRVIGKGTVGAMQSGIFWGYVSLIEGVVRRIRSEMGAPMQVILTGGLSVLFAGSTPVIDHYDADLTMRGLLEVYERNRQK